MARGRMLVEDLLPLLQPDLVSSLDGHVAARLYAMRDRYREYIEREQRRSLDVAPDLHQ
jgi:hypothetical protein